MQLVLSGKVLSNHETSPKSCRTKASFLEHGSILVTFINEGLTLPRSIFLMSTPDPNSQITRHEFQNPPWSNAIKESSFRSVKITEKLTET